MLPNLFRKRRDDRSNKQEVAPDILAADSAWDDPFQLLRRKWGELPVGLNRFLSSEIISLSDDALLAWWEKAKLEATTGPFYKARGWYHTVYMPMMKDASVTEIGTGFGIDGLTFAQVAGHYTFVDIVQENLKLLERLARIMKIKDAAFLWLENYESLGALPFEQDVILASGSLHHAPMRVIKREIQELAPRLRIGGRWLQLAYPKRRWEREGCEPFSSWGRKTDGESTPWAEWYDLEKLLSLFAPHSFEVVMAFDYHDSDFNWFDLIRRS